MRVIGRRKAHPITFAASAALLSEGARFNDEIHRVASGGSTLITKGVFLFKTHADANAQQQECLIAHMVKTALERV